MKFFWANQNQRSYIANCRKFMSILRTGTATFKGAHVNTKESKQGCFDDTFLAVYFEGNAGLISK